jgi:outer membrane autotransporter protein
MWLWSLPHALNFLVRSKRQEPRNRFKPMIKIDAHNGQPRVVQRSYFSGRRRPPLLLLSALISTLFWSPPRTYAAQVVADNTTQTAGGTYDTGLLGPTTGYGLYALNNGTINSFTPVSVITGGDTAHGVEATLGGNIVLNGGSVTTSGDSAIGLYAFLNNATITATDVSVLTTGPSAIGVNANVAGQVILTRGSVTTSGDNADALQTADAAATIDVTGSAITTTGSNSHAAHALAGTMSLTSATLITDGGGSYGGWADNASNLSLLNSAVTTNGTSATGLQASAASTLTANNATVTTNGAGAAGVSSQFGSQVTINGGSVTTTGANAIGLFSVGLQGAIGANLTATGVIVSTSGSGSHGAVIRGASSMTLTNSQVAVTGANAAALFASAFDPGASTAIVTNSVLSSQQGSGISASATTFNVALTNSTVSSNAAVLNSLGGILNVTADTSTLNGASTIAGGGTTNLILRNNAIWNMRGDSVVSSLTNDASQINFSAPAAGVFKTLATTNYVGAGGTLTLNTQLGGDSAPSDKLVINGGAATGTSLLRIMNAGGTGAATTGNGILVVDATAGGTTTANAFALGAPVVAGIYDYGLFRGSQDATAPQSWFLRTTRVRPETSLYPVLPVIGILYADNLIDTLDERMGADSDWKKETDSPEKLPGIMWGRIIGQHSKQDGAANGASGVGPSYAHDFYAAQAGVDLYRSDKQDDYRERAGVYGAIGRGDGNVTHFDGSNAGVDSFDAYTAGAYWTHFGPADWYLDTVLQTTWYEANADGQRGLAPLKTDGMGYTASLEGGYPFRLQNDWLIEPQAQIIYSKLNLGDAGDAGGSVTFHNTDSLTGRLGVRIGQSRMRTGNKNINDFTGWVRLSVLHDFSGNPTTDFTGPNGTVTGYPVDTGDNAAEIKTGLARQFGTGKLVYANLGYRRSFGGNSYSYDGSVGVRMDW